MRETASMTMRKPLSAQDDDTVRRFVASAQRKGFIVHTEPTAESLTVTAVRERDVATGPLPSGNVTMPDASSHGRPRGDVLKRAVVELRRQIHEGE